MAAKNEKRQKTLWAVVVLFVLGYSGNITEQNGPSGKQPAPSVDM